jgi:nucleoside-diphosphate-sugar epimerase
MASSVKKIVVCGGNGFLGSRICKYAVAKGWDVTSIRYVESLKGCGARIP